MDNEKTIFQKIIDREIPANIVYEDDTCIAFLDINPVAKGHTLLVTKHPYSWMQDTPDEIVGSVFVKAKQIMLALQSAFVCDFVEVLVEGKDVPHFHIHLIPSFFEIKNADWVHVQYENGESDLYAEKIKQALL